MFRRICKSLVPIALMISLFASLALPPAWAGEPAAPQLSLKDAIQKALSHSESIKSAGYAVDQAKAQRDKASDSVDYIPAPLGNSPVGDYVWSIFMKADLNWQVQKEVYAGLVDQATAGVVQAYYTIIAKQDAVRNDEKALERDMQALQVARAVYMAGGSPSAVDSSGTGLPAGTKASVMAAEAKVEASRKALECARDDLETAYVTFNRLVGLNPEDRPVLTEKLIYAPLKVDSIDAEAERAVENDKTVAVKNKLKEIAQLDVDYPWTPGTGGSLEYYDSDITEPGVDIKNEDLVKAANDVRQQVRTLYNQITSTEEQYNAVKQSLQAMEESLRVTRAMYQAGMTTRDKILSVEAQYSDLMNKLVGLACSHAAQVAGFCIQTGRPVADGDFQKAVVDTDQIEEISSVNAGSTDSGSANKSTAVFQVGLASFTLNGKQISMDTAPFINSGRTMLPLRYAANAVGIADDSIEWDQASGRVTIKKGSGSTIQVTVGSRVMQIGNQTVFMDVAPQIVDGRVMLPLRYLGQAFNADIQWDGDKRTVTVTV